MSGLSLIPALAARYRDLSTLRYDFPVVLLKGACDGDCIRPLSVIVDDLLREVPTGDDARRITTHVLELEREIRAAVARGERGLLSTLWDRTAARLSGHSELRQDSLCRARLALTVDGELADCDAALPGRALEHAWQTIQAEKGRAFRAHAGRLVLQLTEILRAEFAHSAGGRSSASLNASIGGPLNHTFDFEVMARMLASSTPACTIDDARRRRLHGLISTLRAQQFYPAADKIGLGFSFDSCAAALRAYRERLPLLLDLTSALGAAELEAAGEYNAGRHDAFFDELRAGRLPLDARDRSLFPDYFVQLKAAAIDPIELDALLDVAGCRLPIRVLIEMDDVLPASLPADETAGHLRARHIARIATSLGRSFVLQAPGSHLAQAHDQIARGFAHAGPSLFSIFTGASSGMTGLSPYLIGALALESRVFPAFVYDPGARPEGASVDLSMNPQAAADWPVYELEYEADERQRAADPVTLTAADFIACDHRHARHFSRVDRSARSDGLVPLDRWLALDAAARRGAVPFLLMVDADNRLQRVIVDAAVVREMEAYQEQWRSLRQLGRAAQPGTLVIAPAGGPASETPEVTVVIAAGPEAPVELQAAAAAERGTGDPYIETPRCSSCNECIHLNGRMFMYNADGQAYIGNADAGTFRELVEAAESCQVAIIHPGTPRRQDEPGLEELVLRAAAFQ